MAIGDYLLAKISKLMITRKILMTTVIIKIANIWNEYNI